MLIGGFLMLLFWGIILAGLFLAIRAAVSGSRNDTDRGTGEAALRILSQRYAKGEISAEEYQEMKTVLET